jgi:hypothetical protein
MEWIWAWYVNLAQFWSAEHNVKWDLDRIIDITLDFAVGEPNQRRIPQPCDGSRRGQLVSSWASTGTSIHSSGHTARAQAAPTMSSSSRHYKRHPSNMHNRPWANRKLEKQNIWHSHTNLQVQHWSMHKYCNTIIHENCVYHVMVITNNRLNESVAHY